MTDLTKRIVVRLGDEDLAWIAEQATDEGVDHATFLRMLVNRLRRGRPPLMRMALSNDPIQRSTRSMPIGYPIDSRPVAMAPEPELPMLDGDANDILASRLAEADQLAPPPESQPFDESLNGHEAAAISLHRVDRARYNPGRT